MILALGILMSLSGAGLAVSGLGDSGSGSDVEYLSDDSSTESFSSSSDDSDGDGDSDTGSVDPAGQEASGGTGGGDLPFTGFAAIPVLIGGVALLSSGFVLRRRAGRDEE